MFYSKLLLNEYSESDNVEYSDSDGVGNSLLS